MIAVKSESESKLDVIFRNNEQFICDIFLSMTWVSLNVMESINYTVNYTDEALERHIEYLTSSYDQILSFPKININLCYPCAIQIDCVVKCISEFVSNFLQIKLIFEDAAELFIDNSIIDVDYGFDQIYLAVFKLLDFIDKCTDLNASNSDNKAIGELHNNIIAELFRCYSFSAASNIQSIKIKCNECEKAVNDCLKLNTSSDFKNKRLCSTLGVSLNLISKLKCILEKIELIFKQNGLETGDEHFLSVLPFGFSKNPNVLSGMHDVSDDHDVLSGMHDVSDDHDVLSGMHDVSDVERCELLFEQTATIPSGEISDVILNEVSENEIKTKRSNKCVIS